jgi:hypothetical protein
LTSSLDSYTIRSRKNMIFITDWTIRRLPRKVKKLQRWTAGLFGRRFVGRSAGLGTTGTTAGHDHAFRGQYLSFNF